MRKLLVYNGNHYLGYVYTSEKDVTKIRETIKDEFGVFWTSYNEA